MLLRRLVNVIPDFTVQLTAHQLHAQCACLPTHHWDDSDELGDERRVKQVGLGSFIVDIPNKHLYREGRGVSKTPG